MIRFFYLMIIVICWHDRALAQVVISEGASQPHPSALLDIQTTTRGFLPPKMNTAQRNGISGPVAGLIIYNTDCEDIQYYNGVTWMPGGKEGLLETPGPISGPSEICVNSAGHLFSIAPVVLATYYHWTVPEGAVITSGQGTIAITVSFGSTSGLVCVLALNDCYKSGFGKKSVNVLPIVPVSVFITSGANPVCNGLSVTFTANPVNGGSAPLYQWIQNGANVPGATNSAYVHFPDDGDLIKCQVTSNRGCVTANPALSNQITQMVQTSFTKNHLSGTVAPVTKTVTYGLVGGLAGVDGKCWITRNLGASQQATAVSDATEPPAGWYWQFNRKQGYKHDGTTRTPSTTWVTPISENSDWTADNDPCTLELGTPWRVPTLTEWAIVSSGGLWNNWNGPWNSSLKLHAAGMLDYSYGSLQLRGSYGAYWSSSQTSSGTNTAWFLNFVSSSCMTNGDFKATGFSVRCIK